jgi:hypothetical protein
MKLISYAHANKDLRVLHRRMKKLDTNNHNHSMSRTNLIRSQSNQSNYSENGSMMTRYSRGVSVSGTSNDELQNMVFAPNNANNKLYTTMTTTTTTSNSNITGEQYLRNVSQVKDLQPPYLLYPQNITLLNLLYFLIIPTLCYQLNYPRTPYISWSKVFSLVIRMIFVLLAILFSVEQYIKPTLESVVAPMSQGHILGILERLLKLSLPNTYLWLLGFYFYFHLWLNLLAELTRFGDRSFYKDWWNAKTIDRYWRTWNMPVHHWITRHLCKVTLYYIYYILSSILYTIYCILTLYYILYYTVLYYILHYTIYYTILYYTILYTILYYIL